MKLTCVKCGQVWSVSDKHDKVGAYVCPKCDRRKDKWRGEHGETKKLKSGR